MTNAPRRQIVALGGGGFSMEPRNLLLDDFILSLTGRPQPRVCFLGTASGDAAQYIANFYGAFPPSRAVASHLPLFNRRADDPRETLLTQHVIYVGGGNTANMLLIWRRHGIDAILREAWERGVVLCGISAGMLCWFEACCTDSFGPLAPLHDGLGLLAGSACPHFDGEFDRRPRYQAMIREGPPSGLPDGWAADDGAALHFIGTDLSEVISSRPNARAYRIERRGDEVIERAFPTRFLGASQVSRASPSP